MKTIDNKILCIEKWKLKKKIKQTFKIEIA